MIVDWLAFPLVVLVFSLGCGLLLERVAGWRMSGVLITGAGLALIVVVASLVTQSQTLAPATPWVVLGLAAIGYGASVPRLREFRVDPWQLALAVLLFAVFAAPVVASGQATFLGYGIDGDPGFHFLLIHDVLAHGHRAITYPSSRLVPANLQLMQGYLATGYPLGGDLAIGALRPFVGQDVPWVYDPFLATVLMLGGLTIDELLRGVVRSRPLRALCAFIAAQAGLAYSFLLISSIKELVFTWLLTLMVTLGLRVLQRTPSARALAPPVVALAACLYTLAVPAVPWLAVPVVVFVALSLIRVRDSLRHPDLRNVGSIAVVLLAAVALTWPILRSAVVSYRATTGTLDTSRAGATIGNLLAPLNTWQIMGIWPNGDYRLPITVHVGLVYALLWIAAVSAVFGALWCVQRRSWGPLVLLIGNGLAALLLLERSTPYAAAKVMAILSIAAVLAAMLGAAALHDLVHPSLGWALAVVLALAVLWTNSKSFRQAPLAPRPRLEALAQVDHRFRGEGPTFYNLWDFEWPGYFLRHLNPQLPHIFGDPKTVVGTQARNPYELQIPWDPDDLTLSYLRRFRLLVLGRSPLVSRPPADFRLAYQNRYYDVWRRIGHPRVLAHVSATYGPDAALHGTHPLSCATIRRLGARARAHHAHLAAAVSTVVATASARRSVHPASWVTVPRVINPIPDGLVLSNAGGGLVERIRVPRAGRYTVWLQGTFTRRTSVWIAGRTVGSVDQAIGPAGLVSQVGTVELSAGRHNVVISRPAASFWKSSNPHDALGDLVVTNGSGPATMRQVAANRAQSLCRHGLQWVEIVR